MKRPLMMVAVAAVAAFFLQMIGLWVAPICVLAGLLHYLIPGRKRQVNRYLVIGAITFVSLVFFVVADYRYEGAKERIEGQGSLSGQGIVKEVTVGDYGSFIRLKPWWDSQGRKQAYAVSISSENPAECGQLVSFNGEVRDGLKGYNEGSFNLEKYYREQGIVASVKGSIKVRESTGWYVLERYLADMRQEHYQRLGAMLPERQGAVLAELFLGIEAVEDEDRTLFSDSGTVHILAISGLHVGLVAMMLLKFLGLFFFDQRKNAVAVLLLTLLYCLYTGGHTSTVRAGLMIAVHLGHSIFYRRYDRHTALAFAFLLLVIINPLQVTGVGFLLSFGAVASIFYIGPKLYVGWLAIDNPVIQSIRVLLAIQIGLSPLLVITYHELALYGFAANLLVLPVLAVLIGSTAAALVLSYIHFGFAKFIAGTAFWLVNYLLDILEVISGLPWSTVTLVSPGLFFAVLYYLILILWVLEYRLAAELAAGGLAFALLLSLTLPGDELQIDMMDVGNGDAMFIRYRNEVILIDGGGQVGYEGANTGERVLMPYLAYNGIREIDTVIVSHSDFDHIYGIIELMGQIPIDRIIMSAAYLSSEDEWAGRLKALAKLNDIEVIYVAMGDVLRVEDFSLSILYPFDETPDKDNNRNSLICLIELEDFRMLVTGDAYVEDELALMDKYDWELKGIDVLKVGHHGSKTSSDESFLQELAPAVALISVGRSNLYGHPAPLVVERLEEYADYLYMTKESGQITLIYDDGDIVVDTYID